MAREIRFAVGGRDDLRSSVWRLWANKSDLYLAARSFAGTSKISFHASGVCRYAVVSQTPRPPIDRWPKPARTINGITPVIDVIVPYFPVESSFRDRVPPTQKKLEMIDPPEEGAKRIIRIFLADPDFTERDVLSIPRIAPISFHGRVPLMKEVAWIVSYREDLQPAEAQFIDRLVSTTCINLKAGSSVEEFGFACMHIFEGTEPRRIIDVQLGPGNIYVEQAETDG